MIKLYNPISITKHFVSSKIPPQTFYFQNFFFKKAGKKGFKIFSLKTL